MCRRSSIEIREAHDPLDGDDGDVTLAGVRIGDDREDLAVGDTMIVPVSGGRTVRGSVVQFPLMRFVNSELRAISVVGVDAAGVLIGGRATRAND